MKRKSVSLPITPGNPYLRFVDSFDGRRLLDLLERDREAAMSAGHAAVLRMLCWIYEAHRKYNGGLPAAKVDVGGSPFGGTYQVLERWLNARGVEVRRRAAPQSKTPRPRSSGLVYFITAGDAGFVKIGFTGDMKGRLKSFATGSPHEIKVLLELPGSERLERELHKRFAADRVRENGEWFRLSAEIDTFIAAEKAKQQP